MIAYTVTSANKVWMIDDSKPGVKIPQWCYEKEGYHVVEELPLDIQDLITSLNLAKLRDTKLKDIENAYHKANQENISYMETEFQMPYDSQATLANNLSVGSVPDDFYWRDINDKKIFMTFEEASGLAKAVQVRGFSNFDKRCSLKDKAELATTVEDLEVIGW